jgi:putative SOS response-associated peptidase YedK
MIIMCGRFTQYFTYAELHAYWSAFSDPLSTPPTNLQPRWHLCPTDPVWVVTHGDKGFALEHMRWGLAPFWWKQPLKKLPATFNARAETVDTKPMFREAFKRRRAIIPASGWYEWQVREDGKQPWYFTPKNEPIALIAALWETWKNPEPPHDTVRSSTMIITEPNEFVAQYHDRMPVVLDRADVEAWLSGAKGLELLKPAPEHALNAWPVSRVVNSSKAPDSPELIAPIALAD